MIALVYIVTKELEGIFTPLDIMGLLQGWGSTYSNFVDKSTVGGENGFDSTVDIKSGIDPTSTTTSTSYDFFDPTVDST